LFSGRGNWLLFKDDHLNPSGQWAHPQCGQAGDDLSECSTKMVNCSNTVAPDVENLNKGSNPYYKHKEECRLYAGAPTPQNAASALPQSGVQLQSIAGYQLVFDDSVEQPSGNPDWRLDFDFGCTDKFIGKAFLKSVTGHSITMKDIESSKGVRDDGNGIVLETACGIKVELNDHTVGNAGNAEEGEENAQDAACPPNSAGKNRGYKVTTTSNHVFAMIDEGNQQCSPMRMSGGLPIAKASAGKVYIKTGYGLEFVMDDSTSQENTKAQSVQILCPQKDNQEAGPHVFLMQESADAATSDSFTSFVFLRAGGQLNIETYGDSVEVVGSESNPSNKIFSVSDQFVVECKNVYFAADESILHYAKENIYLLAGQDCPDTSVEGQLDPCVAPVIVFKDGLLQISDRVFAAAGSGAQKVQLQMVMGGKSGGSSQTN
jgi:hypothetical protein